ncbi:MAG: 7-cyano-7-deazaguanine synthase [Xanthobacteraceae bacterium]
MINRMKSRTDMPTLRIAVLEKGQRASRDWETCMIGSNLDFSTERLESYVLSSWKPLIFDALLVAAAVEFCDRTQKRPALGWGRDFHLQIPVHDRAHWVSKGVSGALIEALDFLTGDHWNVTFVQRKKSEEINRQSVLEMPLGIQAVLPFSDGMDSRAVAGLKERELKNHLILVRLGSKRIDRPSGLSARQPFATVPYRVVLNTQGKERSARSRGFKFATVSGVAAFLIGAPKIIVPESGQGALGSALVAVGHAYEDVRNHPLFTDRMEKYLHAVFGHEVKFEFPRLWATKGETLAEYAKGATDDAHLKAWSCWQNSRQVSVDGRKRQCGICAACMLRRLSVHAAGLSEAHDTYVWEDLSAPTFKKGAARGFKHVTEALHQYAIAGTLHLDHLAGLRSAALHKPALKRTADLLARSQKLSPEEAELRLDRLLAKHETEWRAFVTSLGPSSFVAKWVAIRR